MLSVRAARGAGTAKLGEGWRRRDALKTAQQTLAAALLRLDFGTITNWLITIDRDIWSWRGGRGDSDWRGGAGESVDCLELGHCGSSEDRASLSK